MNGKEWLLRLANEQQDMLCPQERLEVVQTKQRLSVTFYLKIKNFNVCNSAYNWSQPSTA